MLFNIITVYIVQLFEVTCVYVQGTSTWWRWATELFRYPAESLDYGIHAVMVDTRKKRVTMQGLGTPVSAAGQGGKAGPQASSSCDRSSTLVGNLANVEYKTTRRKSLSHDCDINRDVFCYICCKYEVRSLRKKIDDTIKIKYHEIFGLHISEHPWVPNIICNACKVMLNRWEQNKNVIKYSSPAEWNKPLRTDLTNSPFKGYMMYKTRSCNLPAVYIG